MLKVAMVQMASTNNLEANLLKMEAAVSKAASQKADVVVFPEMAYFMGPKIEYQKLVPKFNEITETFKSWCVKYNVDIVPGSLREPVEGCPSKHYNTALYIDRSGKLLGGYRKIFLFKASLEDREYDEEHSCVPGREISVIDTSWGKAGIAICFDLRFPELFRSLRKRESIVIFLPSAFTVPTGKAHWKSLLCARAIENQAYLIAPGLVGKCGDGRTTYGHSTIISPWGEVLDEMGDSEGISFNSLPLDVFEKIRNQINVWAGRREDILPIS